jgi:hypothetical protein
VWICKQFAASALAMALVVIAAAHCGPSPTCARYSDCASGLTCADGKCVSPTSEGGLDGAGQPADDASGAASNGDGAPSDDTSAGDDGTALAPGASTEAGDDATAD